MRTLFFLLAFVFAGTPALAAAPFRLLTTEAARNPDGTAVIGFHEVGANFGRVLVDTNPLMDLGLTPNLGAKLAFGEGPLTYTVGTRYLRFVGSSLVERLVKNRTSLVEKFSLEYSGFMTFLGATYQLERTGIHFNFQHADISGSKVLGAVLAVDQPFSETWSGLLEVGYDFANKLPRASIGVGRFGPTFGMRLGATYVSIEDPSFTYKGVLPVIDLYWILGGTSPEPAPTPAPEGEKP